MQDGRRNIVVNGKILNPLYPLAGVQRYLLELLDRMGALAEADGFRLQVLRPRLRGAMGHAWEQAILPLRCRGSLLWSPSNTGPLLVARQVVTVHDVIPLEHPESLEPSFSLWYRLLVPRLVRSAAHVIADSDFTRQRLMELLDVPAERISAIPLGVHERFRPRTEEEIAAVRNALRLPSARYVLSVGSLAPHKNLRRLLDAWSMLAEGVPNDLWLVVSGCEQGGVYRKLNLQALPPRVHFTGHVGDDSLPALYSGAEVFVYVSLFEGFGLPILEAMGAGTPVLCGNRTSLPEVAAEAAVTVNPYDVEGVAAELRRLLDDAALRHEIRQRGLARAKLFSWARTAGMTWSILRRFADGPGPNG